MQLSRRQFLTGCGAGGQLLIAGCFGWGESYIPVTVANTSEDHHTLTIRIEGQGYASPFFEETTELEGGAETTYSKGIPHPDSPLTLTANMILEDGPEKHIDLLVPEFDEFRVTIRPGPEITGRIRCGEGNPNQVNTDQSAAESPRKSPTDGEPHYCE
jgi:hypothetical protein